MTLRHDPGPGQGPPGGPAAGASGSGTGAPGSGVTAAGPMAPAAPAGPIAPATPAGPGQDRPARPRRRGALAAALTITGAALLGLAGLTTFLLIGHHRPPPQPRPPLPAALRLRTGECIDSAANGVSGLRVVPCGLAHDGEVYATFRLARQAWPGPAVVAAHARQGCTARIGGYLSPQLAAAIMTESYIVPGQGAWEAGVRTVVCEIHSATGQLTGSVRGLK